MKSYSKGISTQRIHTLLKAAGFENLRSVIPETPNNIYVLDTPNNTKKFIFITNIELKILCKAIENNSNKDITELLKEVNSRSLSFGGSKICSACYYRSTVSTFPCAIRPMDGPSTYDYCEDFKLR